jgi:hypothetical protein
MRYNHTNVRFDTPDAIAHAREAVRLITLDTRSRAYSILFHSDHD